jgi:hypothetical protein
MNTILLAELVNPNVNLPIVLPEMIVALTGIIVMLYDSFVPKQRNRHRNYFTRRIGDFRGRFRFDVERSARDGVERNDRARRFAAQLFDSSFCSFRRRRF